MEKKNNYLPPRTRVLDSFPEPVMVVSGRPGAHTYDEGCLDDEGAWTDDD